VDQMRLVPKMMDKENQPLVLSRLMSEKTGLQSILFKRNKVVITHKLFLIFRIRIDYSSLRSQLKDLDDPDDKKKIESNLGKKLNECIANIQRINAPNLKVGVM